VVEVRMTDTRRIINAALSEFVPILLDGAWEIESDPHSNVVQLAYVYPPQDRDTWGALAEMQSGWMGGPFLGDLACGEGRISASEVSGFVWRFNEDEFAAQHVARVVFEGLDELLLVLVYDFANIRDDDIARVMLAFEIGRVGRCPALQAMALDEIAKCVHLAESPESADALGSYVLPQCDEDGHETLDDLRKLETLVAMSRHASTVVSDGCTATYWAPEVYTSLARHLLDLADAALAHPAKARKARQAATAQAVLRGSM
jgi:hypothetical protein